MIYSSHPSKGLTAAIGVLQALQKKAPRFTLHVCGGNRLWGGVDESLPQVPGLIHHGLLGQRVLALEYWRSSFAIHLQTREEPFGISLVESMAAGCIAIASPAGAYSELIRNEIDGLLLPGDPLETATQARAAELILGVLDNPKRMRGMQRNARRAPLAWSTVAHAFEQHMGCLLGQVKLRESGPCPECGLPLNEFVDAIRCAACGYHHRRW